MAIFQKVEDLIKEIEILLENQANEINENGEVDDLIKTKRELIQRIQDEFLDEEKDIKRAISFLEETHKPHIQFLKYLENQLSCLRDLVREGLSGDENTKIKLKTLQLELKIILEIKNFDDFKNILELHTRVSQDDESFLDDHRISISEEEIDLLTSDDSLSHIRIILEWTFSTNAGKLLLGLLKESCESSERYKLLLEKVFTRGLLQNSKIQQLEPNELLEVIKAFISLKKDCQSDETYEDILFTGFINGILRNYKIQNLEFHEFLEVIKAFISLKKDCQSDETYRIILLYSFSSQILNHSKIKEIEIDELLKVIKVFGKAFIDLREDCQGDETHRIILENGFHMILNHSKIKEIEIDELLKVIKVFGKAFIDLRKDCQGDETHRITLSPGLNYVILQNSKIKEIEIDELLKVIKVFGKAFIDLRKDCESDETYRSILYWGFANGILKNPKIQQLEGNELLEVIKVFGKAFCNLKYIEQDIFEYLNILIEKIIFDLNFKNYEEKINLIVNFFNKQIRNSKDKRKIIKKLENFNQNKIISYIIIYYIKYRQKSLIDFIQNINIINELNLDINIRFLEKSIKPLTEMDERELKLVFSISDNEKTNLENFYNEICPKLNYENEKELNQLKNYISSINYKIKKQEFDNILYENYLKPLTDIFANLILNYFDNLKKYKIENKFIQDFNLEKINYELVDENFLEVYKMYSSNRLTENKETAFNLLKNYLEGNCYPQKSLLKSYPYNLENNLNWIKNQFGSGFFGVLKARRFFSENREEFLIKESSDNEEEKNKTLQHHLEVSNRILKKYEIKVFENYEVLVKYFSNEKNIENLKEKISENDFNDLELQVNSIKNILSSKTKKEISKVSIYLELNPIKICLMGNRVDGSCLSFYNLANNYWSVFSNMVDMNKLVFYIEDDFKNVMGRVLCCFNKDKTLMRFRLYSKGGIGEKYNLNKYFDIYIKKLAKKFNIKLSNKLDVEKLNCRNWYIDPIYMFTN